MLLKKAKAVKNKLTRRYPRRRPQIHYPIEFHGTEYGGWVVYPEMLSSESLVYSFGIGEDISFDLSLLDKYNLTVCAFDPTPRALQWVQSLDIPERFQVYPFGLEAQDGTMTFYPPENPQHISHSTIQTDKNAAQAIEVPMKRLQTIVGELGHSHIDVIKMDIEGSEYAVIEDIVQLTQIEVRQILVEFHPQFFEDGLQKTRQAIRTMNDNGYKIFHVAPQGRWEYAFIKI